MTNIQFQKIFEGWRHKRPRGQWMWKAPTKSHSCRSVVDDVAMWHSVTDTQVDQMTVGRDDVIRNLWPYIFLGNYYYRYVFLTGEGGGQPKGPKKICKRQKNLFQILN